MSGTSHSGAANSFSPSELLLWPGSDTEPLDSSLDSRVGRTSSSFPSAVAGKHQVLKQKARGAKFSFFLLLFSKLTSLFLHLSGFGDVGVRVERLGGEALALLVLQWRHVWQLQRTERTVKRFL